MGILSWILFGYIIGLIARAVMPGRQNMGFIMTTLLGVSGALAGGLVASALTAKPLAQFSPSGFIGSLIGAFVLLFVAGGLFTRRRVVA